MEKFKGIDEALIQILVCPQCNFISQELKAWDAHLSNHRCPLTVRLQRCILCGALSNSDKIINEHVQMWHPSRSVNDVIVIACEEAYHQDVKPSVLEELKTSAAQVPYQGMEKVPIDASDILVLACPECSFIMLKIASLDEHLKEHDCRIQVKLNKCKQCGMVTNSEKVIEEHVQIWHPSKEVKENVAVVFDETYNQDKPAAGSRKKVVNDQPVAVGRQMGTLSNLPPINLLQLMNMAHGPVEINLPGAYQLDRTKDGVHACISYMPGFIAKTVGEQFLDILKQELSWKQMTATLKDGTQRQEPRLTCYVGPDFEFCGNKFENCNTWNPKLQELKSLVEQVAGRSFNSVICYMYRNGRDSLGWHCENEKQLGEHPYIAAVTLGQGRYQEFMRKGREDRYVRVRATHGDLVITEGAIEDLWLHRVPKDQMARRTSFTFSFRNINPKPAVDNKEPESSKASEIPMEIRDPVEDESKSVKKNPGPVGSGKAKKK